MDDENSEITLQPLPSDRITLNAGGKLFETTVSTLQSAGPESLLAALSNRPSPDPIFIDRDPEIFSVLLSLLRTNRLPSTALRLFTKQELLEESSYYGIEFLLKSSTSPPPLNGVDASLTTTITPYSHGVVSSFSVYDVDGSLLIAHGGQISGYDSNLTHSTTIRTHLNDLTSIKRVLPEIAAVGSENSGGIHFYSLASGRRVGSCDWTDKSDPRIYKARVTAIADSADSVFAAFDCYHKENCVLTIDKSTLKVSSEFGRQTGSSTKTTVAGKLTYLPQSGVVLGSSVTSSAFGYAGYVRLWDPRSGSIVWETNEPGSGRSSRYGDSFADVAVDSEEEIIFKVCSKSGDLAVADLRKLGQDPWVYLVDKNPSLRNNGSGGGNNSVMHCYRKQVFVGRNGELEVWSRVVEREGNTERECRFSEESYRRNYVDKVEDSERGVINKIEGGGDRLFVSREEQDDRYHLRKALFSGELELDDLKISPLVYGIESTRWVLIGLKVWFCIDHGDFGVHCLGSGHSSSFPLCTLNQNNLVHAFRVTTFPMLCSFLSLWRYITLSQLQLQKSWRARTYLLQDCM